MSDIDVGPIDYLALVFPGAKLNGDGLNALVDLIDRGVIRVLDLRFVKRETDGTITGMTVADFDGDGVLDVAVFAGVESGLLGEDDLGEFASLVDPGDAVGVVVYENTWAGPFVSAMRTAGAEVIASERIPALDVAARLDELEGDLAGASA
jgi:Family of unknown function (DUF6325)